MLFNFFRQPKKQKNTPSAISPEPIVHATISENGMVYPAIPLSAQQSWADQQRIAYLAQLDEEGFITTLNNQLLLAWEDLYKLLKEPAHLESVPLLDLPKITDIRPNLLSQHALSDLNFQIMIQSWQLPNGTELPYLKKTVGATFTLNDEVVLLPESVWQLLQAIKHFYQEKSQAPSEQINQQGWANIRKLAKSCKAGMDNFLTSTIVLNPEKLKLNLNKTTISNTPVISIEPSFEGQPENWINQFDRYRQVQDRYRIPSSDGSITHVLLPDSVKSVLENIKKLPGRMAAGDEALRFIRNPYSALGEDAEAVLDVDEFETSRSDAGICFYRFSLQPLFSELNQIKQIYLLLEPSTSPEQNTATLSFQTAHEFARFVQELTSKFNRELPCGFWQGYELELSDFNQQQLQGLQYLLNRWQKEAMGQLFEEIFDIKQYGDRVIGIGLIEKPSSPFLVKETTERWIPEQTLHTAGLEPQRFEEMDKATLTDYAAALKENIQNAINQNAASVHLPGYDVDVSIGLATQVAQFLDKKIAPTLPKSQQSDIPSERVGLLIHDHIESAETIESITAQFDTNTPVELPASLKEDIKLRAHQQIGVAWLQNLFKHTPSPISGCLLADDMGLGKTLQLLTFIIRHLESNPQSLPVLIVAPVSLLDNWEQELNRFFYTTKLPTLKLYGEALKAVKLKQQEIPQDLLNQGIKNLLRPEWIGEAKIVLTTYETMRDQELSIAKQRWSIMVCDEAQKIKNPTAMVTQSAKAIQALFKIACTGTPVENSLTDLWCLFDFAQPKLLGALNEFGKKYLKPIECKTEKDLQALESLRQKIDPLILRRVKEEVANDLPQKREVENCRHLPMSVEQEKLYLSAINDFQNVSELSKQTDQNNIAILSLLHRLKMLCAHPQDYLPNSSPLESSPKMAWLIQTLRHIQEKNEKVIIFTESRAIQRDLQLIIMKQLGLNNIPIINGDTHTQKNGGRQGIINQFQSQKGFGVIILSTIAVGFGVNVQAANHVIHFTRPWNPAKEDQATDRAYRIGQTKDVFVYYPTIVSNQFETFEYKLDRLLSSKREIAKDMLNGAEDIDILALAK